MLSPVDATSGPAGTRGQNRPGRTRAPGPSGPPVGLAPAGRPVGVIDEPPRMATRAKDPQEVGHGYGDDDGGPDGEQLLVADIDPEDPTKSPSKKGRRSAGSGGSTGRWPPDQDQQQPEGDHE